MLILNCSSAYLYVTGRCKANMFAIKWNWRAQDTIHNNDDITGFNILIKII